MTLVFSNVDDTVKDYPMMETGEYYILLNQYLNAWEIWRKGTKEPIHFNIISLEEAKKKVVEYEKR